MILGCNICLIWNSQRDATLQNTSFPGSESSLRAAFGSFGLLSKAQRSIWESTRSLMPILRTASELLHCRSRCHLYFQENPLPNQCGDFLPFQPSSSKIHSSTSQDCFQFLHKPHRLPLQASHLHIWDVNYMQAYSLKHNHENKPQFLLLFWFSHQKAFVRSLG